MDMLDIRYIRENPEKVQLSTNNKGYGISIAELLQLDESRRSMQQRTDVLRENRNANAAKMKGGVPEQSLIDEGKRLKTELADFEKELDTLEVQYNELLRAVPNVALDSVPVGSSEDDNVVVRTVGEKPVFDFEPKSHWQIAEVKGWIDKERASKIAGARFAYLKGPLVRLENALWQFGMDVLENQEVLSEIITDKGLSVSNKPFIPVIPPAVARTEVFQATGRLNKEEQTYKLEGEDLWLNASAEHTMAPMYMNEIIDRNELPIRLVGYTTAFRREAGTYGKDAEGIFRLHQFNKLEMESFSTAESSLEEHELMVAIQEYFMQKLGLHYRVLEKCTADIGRPNAKGVDIDTWLAGQEEFRETHTADYITDYQARPMSTRTRTKDGKIEFVHTNDATAFSERPLVAILEHYQTVDGNVIIPEVLRQYMGGREIL